MVNLQQLLERLELDQYDTYGVEELRGGFFDASFFRPLESIKNEERLALLQAKEDQKSLKGLASYCLKEFISKSRNYIMLIFRTRRGLDLFKSFLAYYLAYILCLIPKSQHWLGSHSYLATISVLFNHSGRTLGAQIDGCILCIFGGALGVAWACLAWELSSSATSELAAKCIMAVLLVVFSLMIAWVRSSFVRFSQAVMSAGLAVYYLCLSEPNNLGWTKGRIWNFAIPWLMGQALSLVVNVLIVPGAGNREIAVALHQALMSALDVLTLPRAPSPELHNALNMHLVTLSEAYRDMRCEITISRFNPGDVEQLRNILQAVIRDLMSVDTNTSLFDDSTSSMAESIHKELEHGIEVAIPLQKTNGSAVTQPQGVTDLELVKTSMAPPTRELIGTMTEGITVCNNALMENAGHRELSIAPNSATQEALALVANKLDSAMAAFDEADTSLIDNPLLPSSYSKNPEVVKIFLFIHPIRQTANSVKELLKKVKDLAASPPSPKVFPPNYPWKKALNRSSPQVRHDRGGMTAGYYYRSKREIDAILRIDEFNPGSFHQNEEEGTTRHHIWGVLHRLQEFESRFAFKVALVITMLSLPAYLQRHHSWYYGNGGWWAAAAAWFTMHPRVGGNAQDLVTRSAAAVVGALWGGIAYAVGSGNPYGMGVVTLLFMFPAIIRRAQSSHPRSGLIACLSYSVVSLRAYNLHGYSSVQEIAWTRGTAMVVGICVAVMVNWCLWPFIARHELRKSIACMMSHLSISYRGIISRYIYHDEGVVPSEEHIRLSQIQESRLREGFFRIRELLGMTRHEIRLRGPFNPTPYIRLINACEQFFEHMVKVRQASLFFRPFSLIYETEYNKALLSARRDAVASIIINLNTMSSGLRNKTPIPKYLPSAAVARKKLIDRMAEIESVIEAERIKPVEKLERSRRWADVYQYAYSTALTDIVGQLEQMEVITKEIVGEVALDLPKDL